MHERQKRREDGDTGISCCFEGVNWEVTGKLRFQCIGGKKDKKRRRKRRRYGKDNNLDRKKNELNEMKHRKTSHYRKKDIEKSYCFDRSKK